MKKASILLLIFALFNCEQASKPEPQTLSASMEQSGSGVCVSLEEEKLFNLINNYRKSKKLKVVPFSANLSKVAQLHAKDLALKAPHKKGNCNLHSWSDGGKWKGCCYTSDHKRASCMWDKPRELTSYKGNGYEISAYYSEAMTAEKALQTWKDSPPHHDVILSKSIWKDAPWNAMGVGIYKGYAMVWFGNEVDAENVVKRCK